MSSCVAVSTVAPPIKRRRVEDNNNNNGNNNNSKVMDVIAMLFSTQILPFHERRQLGSVNHASTKMCHDSIALLPTLFKNTLTRMISPFEDQNPLLHARMSALTNDYDRFDPKIYRTKLDQLSRMTISCLLKGVTIDRNNLSIITAPLYAAETFCEKLREAQTASKWRGLQKVYKLLLKEKDFVEAMHVTMLFDHRQARSVNAINLFKEMSSAKATNVLWQEVFQVIPEGKAYLHNKKQCISEVKFIGNFSLCETLIDTLPKEHQSDLYVDLAFVFLQLGNLEETRRIAEKIEEQDRNRILSEVEDLTLRQKEQGRVFGTEEDIVATIESYINDEDFDEVMHDEAIDLAEKLYRPSLRQQMLIKLEIARASADWVDQTDVETEGEIDEGDEGEESDVSI